MRKLKKVAAVTVMAGGLVAVGTGSAFADADGSSLTFGSPGFGSGNNVQTVINAPINNCGTITLLGAVNPSFGNNCIIVD